MRATVMRHGDIRAVQQEPFVCLFAGTTIGKTDIDFICTFIVNNYCELFIIYCKP